MMDEANGSRETVFSVVEFTWDGAIFRCKNEAIYSLVLLYTHTHPSINYTVPCTDRMCLDKTNVQLIILHLRFSSWICRTFISVLPWKARLANGKICIWITLIFRITCLSCILCVYKTIRCLNHPLGILKQTPVRTKNFSLVFE